MSEHFDKHAKTWDENPQRVERAKEFAAKVREVIGEKPISTALDFGCGTGLVSIELQKDIGAITLLDSSIGMVDVVRSKIDSQGITNFDVKAGAVLDAAFDGKSYDLIYSLLVLHHIKEVKPVVTRLVSLLADGGMLIVGDFEAEDGSFHEAGVAEHNGFEPSYLKAMLEEAGLTVTACERFTEAHKHGRTYPLFYIAAGK